MLSVNGLDEVPVDPASLLTFRFLGHMPLLIHPNPQDVMVLALGGGITTGSVATHPVRKIDVVELCPAVVRAARNFKQWNHGVLDDARLNIIIQDGRNHLLTTPRKYDVITADATHPWSADSWILYTREMYRLVRSRLNTNGIFSQWVPMHWLSESDFKCILRTMRTVFPHVSIWYTGSYVVVLGSDDQPAFSPAVIKSRMTERKIGDDLAAVGITSVSSLLGLYFFSNDDVDAFVGPGPLNTDDFTYLEHSAARCFGRETTPENLSILMEKRISPATLLSDKEVVGFPSIREQLIKIYAAREKTILGRISTYRGRFGEAVKYYHAALKIAPEDGVTEMLLNDAVKTLAAAWATNGDGERRAGHVREAMKMYVKALELDPTEPRAHNGIGLILFMSGKYTEALHHYDTALVRLKNQIEIRYNRTLALLKLKKTDEARKELEVIQQLEEEGASHHSEQLSKLINAL